MIEWSVSAGGTSRVSFFLARSKKSRPMTRGVAESISGLRCHPGSRRRRLSGTHWANFSDVEFDASWIPALAPLGRDDKLGCRRHRVELSARHHTEHAPAIHFAL